MKVLLTGAFVWCCLATGVFADRPVSWQHDLGPAGGGGGSGVASYMGQDPAGWAVVMFKDGGDSTMSGFKRDPWTGGKTTSLGDDIVATNSSATQIETAIQYGYGGAGSEYMYYSQSVSVIPGQSVFTVVFNHSDMDQATHYVIVDDALYNIPSGDLPVDYNAGSAAASEWQEIQREEASPPVILSFGNGVLVWSNASPGSTFTIEWAADLTDSNAWESSYDQLENITPTSSIVTNKVPMFYRVRMVE